MTPDERAHLAELEQLYNSAPCGYHSADGTILRVDQTALEMLGCDRDEIVGKVKFQQL
jgi:PAS domain-containing protein